MIWNKLVLTKQSNQLYKIIMKRNQSSIIINKDWSIHGNKNKIKPNSRQFSESSC